MVNNNSESRIPRPHRKLRGRVILAIIAIGLIGIYAWNQLTRWDYLQIQEITFKGLEMIPVNLASRHVQNLNNHNLLAIKRSEIAETLKPLIQIESWRIRKYYPDKLEIQVIEKNPDLLINSDGKRYVVTRAGLILNTFSEIIFPEMETLPIANNVPISAKDIKNGKINPLIMQRVIKVIDSLKDFRPLSLEWQGENVTLFYDDVIEIKLGSYNNIEKKVNIVNKLLHTIKTSMIEYIDVRIPRYPVIRIKRPDIYDEKIGQ